LRAWAYTCQSALHELFSLYKPFFLLDSGDREADFVLWQLSANCMMTSESALLLVQSARVWDAEMLVRSVLEGTYKFAFMCVRDDSERSQRIREYYDDLPEISRIKRHERAVALLADVENPDAPECRPLRDLLLADEEIESLRQQFPRKARQALEQKWAFIPLAQSLAQSELPGADAVARMVHGYGMSSHLLHQDGSGVAMVWERQSRSKDRESAINLSHGAREISDLLNMSVYRLVAAYHLKGMDPASVYSVRAKYKPLTDELGRAYTEFYDLEYGDVQ
jgi:hypothetical protein